jgi:Helix-turn-helix domain
MSWRVVKCVLEHHEQEVHGLDLLVLVYLSNHANGDDGSGAWPSQVTLASKTGIHRATVQRVLTRLVAMGAVEVEQRPGRTHRFSVRMCALCLPLPTVAQSGTGTNGVPHRATGGAAQSDRGCRTVRHESLKNPPLNLVVVGSTADAAADDEYTPPEVDEATKAYLRERFGPKSKSGQEQGPAPPPRIVTGRARGEFALLEQGAAADALSVQAVNE